MATDYKKKFTDAVDRVKAYFHTGDEKTRKRRKKLALAAVCIVVFLALTKCASAQDAGNEFYAPLQPAHAGLWYDVDQVGEGVNVFEYQDTAGRFRAGVLFYGGKRATTEAPGWYTADVALSGKSQTVDLFATDTFLGSGSASQARTKVGTLELRAGLTCEALDATINVAGKTINYELVRLVPGEYTDCNKCRAVDFAPFPPGCGSR